MFKSGLELRRGGGVGGTPTLLQDAESQGWFKYKTMSFKGQSCNHHYQLNSLDEVVNVIKLIVLFLL